MLLGKGFGFFGLLICRTTFIINCVAKLSTLDTAWGADVGISPWALAFWVVVEALSAFKRVSTIKCRVTIRAAVTTNGYAVIAELIPMDIHVKDFVHFGNLLGGVPFGKGDDKGIVRFIFLSL